MSTTLYLVRHGETVDNVAQIMQGQRQGELTPDGIAQIERLASRLRDCCPDYIVASDLQRSRHSAQILAAVFQLPVVCTPLLRERDWGDFTGRYIPDLQGLPMPGNVETIEALRQRALSFIRWVDALPAPGGSSQKLVMAVGHGIINKAIQAVHFGKRMPEIPKMQNAEYRVLEW